MTLSIICKYITLAEDKPYILFINLQQPELHILIQSRQNPYFVRKLKFEKDFTDHNLPKTSDLHWF